MDTLLGYFSSIFPKESLMHSKEKWNSLARKNAKYFILSDYGRDVSADRFQDRGEEDVLKYVIEDKYIKGKLGDLNTKTAVEIGCGLGRLTEFLGKYFKSVTAVDISEEMVKKASERLGHISNISFSANNGYQIPAQDKSVDFVFSFITFQHMPDEMTIQNNLHEIDRVLKNGGVAKIQFRGEPTFRLTWFYGQDVSLDRMKDMMSSLSMKIVHTEGANTKYFWVTFSK